MPLLSGKISVVSKDICEMVAREILKIAGNAQNIEQLIRPTRVVLLFKHYKMLVIRKMR